jgi:hypothetical protein
MTDEEKASAAAYMKLQDDVKQLIIDTVCKELHNYSSSIHGHIKSGLLHTFDFEQRIRDIIRNQMTK